MIFLCSGRSIEMKNVHMPLLTLAAYRKEISFLTASRVSLLSLPTRKAFPWSTAIPLVLATLVILGSSLNRLAHLNASVS